MIQASPSIRRACVALLLLTTPLACERSEEPSPAVTIGQAYQHGSSSKDEAAPPGPADEEAAKVEEESADEEASETSPAAPAVLPEGTEEQQRTMNIARAAFLSDRYETAEELFGELARVQPVTGTTVSAAIALAQIYIETDRPHLALDLLDDVRESVDELPEVLLVIARVYHRLDQPAEALQAFDKALQIQPHYIFLLTEMAEIFFEQGDQERGAQLLLHYEQRLEELAGALENPAETPEAQRFYLVDIFALIHDERGHQALIHALQDPSDSIRSRAAEALGELRVTDAVEALRQTALEDESEIVRPAARQALQAISAGP